MFQNTKVRIIVGIVFLFALIAFFVVFFERNNSASSTPVSDLIEQNQNYALARTYQNQGNYESALQYYQKALPQIQDPSQQAPTQFDIAFMNELNGSYAQAIDQFKQIASNDTTYTNSGMIRAYAVQELGFMYYKQYWSSPKTAQAISANVFTGTPYAAFQQQAGGSTSLAYRQLFEYAVSFYPLGYAEGRIANWYANDLVTTLKGATTTPQGTSDISMVVQSIQKADADVQRTNTPQSSSYSFVPGILQLEGVAVGELANVGAASPTQAENYFKQSIALATSSKPGNFTAYDYALFLARQYGTQRSTDIQHLLAPFKQGNGANISSSMLSFLKLTESGAPYASQKKGIAQLAQLDPAFKNYLISLGWHASDF